MRAKWRFGARCVYIFGSKKLTLEAHISCMAGCTETAVIVNFFDLIQLVFNSIFSDWYLCTQSIHLHSAGRCFLITSLCSLMRSACGPDSKATSMMLMWGQETAVAITSWAEIRYRTYGRHFREENRSRMARKTSDAGLQCHHAPRPWKHWHHLINGDAFRVSGVICGYDLR